MTRLALALILGLLAATVPILATSGQCPQTASSEVPRYLIYASDESTHEIRCSAGTHATFERMRSADAVTSRVRDEAVAGVIVDRYTNVTLPREAVATWASTGSGRTVIGLGLRRAVDPIAAAAAKPMSSRSVFEVPPDDPRRPGLQSIGHVSYKSCASGTSGGEGTIEYSGRSPLGALLTDRSRC